MKNLEIAMSRTWAEINLDEFAHNFKILKNILNPNAKFLGVIKANAYDEWVKSHKTSDDKNKK